MTAYAALSRRPGLAFAIFALFVVALEVAMSGGLPPDQLEAVWWGREAVSVTPKHPAGSGWIHYGWMVLAGNSNLAGHALGALNFLAAVAILWLLLRRLDFAPAQITAALWLTLASVNTYLLIIKYNANSAPMPFWLLGALGLWVGVSGGRLWGWVTAGLAIGAASLIKYHTALWLIVALVWLLSGREERRAWTTPGPFVAAAIFAAIFSLHLIDLQRFGWPGLAYGAENLTDNSGPFGHLVNPLRYLGLQVAFASPGLIVALVLLRRGPRSSLGLRGRFLVAFGVAFPVAPAFVALATGGSLGEMWGIGTAALAVPFLLHWQARPDTAPRIGPQAARTGLTTIGAFTAILLAAQPWREPEYPIAAAMAQISAALTLQEGRDLRFVMGQSREAEGATWHLHAHPRYVDGDAWEAQPWTARDLRPGDLVLIEAATDDLDLCRLRIRPIREIEVDVPRRDSLLHPTRGYRQTFTLATIADPVLIDCQRA